MDTNTEVNTADHRTMPNQLETKEQVHEPSTSAPSSAPPSDPEANVVPPKKSSVFADLNVLERFLAVWIILAIAIGMILGNFVPSTGPALQKGSFVGVGIPVAVGLLVMIYPILCRIRFEALPGMLRTRAIWVQIGFSLVVNWVVAPLIMLGLSWAFLPDRAGLRDGLILVGLGRCIAMVLIWTRLAGGDNEACAILVGINSVLQIVLYAPLAVLYIKVISRSNDTIVVEYQTVARSVAVFLGIPLLAAIITRFGLRKLVSGKWYDGVFLKVIDPWSLIGLLFTILVLFASQGQRVAQQIISIVRVSAPLIVYFGVLFFATLFVTYKMGFNYGSCCTQSFTAASNNFELAIAVAVSTYGIGSDQALATTVGPLIEVPVLVSLVYVARYFGRRWLHVDGGR